MLTYYINRAGKGLSAEDKARLQEAKELLSRRVEKRAKENTSGQLDFVSQSKTLLARLKRAPAFTHHSCISGMVIACHKNPGRTQSIQNSR